MISIAVCDDDAEKGRRIVYEVEKCLNRNKIVYEKQLFTSSKALLHEIADRKNFDLLLLDIELPDINGLELTEQLKRFLPDVLIIFVTSYEKYVYESFKVQPYRFIPKRCLKEMLVSALMDAVKYIEENKGKFYLAENQSGMENIPLRSILYIWHREKYAYIERTNGESTKVRKTLKQVYQELSSGDFEWVDRGCICNLSQIAQITSENIVFTNGTQITAGRDRIRELKDKLRRYWVGQKG